MTDEYACTTFHRKYVCNTSFEVLSKILDKFVMYDGDVTINRSTFTSEGAKAVRIEESRTCGVSLAACSKLIGL